jgi:hypothetical protein
MSQELCVRGRELFKKASQADELFKARLLEFFSSTKKDDREMKQIEVLGETHRDADEAFHRTKDSVRPALKRPWLCCGTQPRSDCC